MASMEHILLVENDPEISDLIARQALQSLGYRVEIVTDAASALKKAVKNPPDLVIANLNLPDLSAKDLLVALTSQDVHTPLMVIAGKGQEQDVVQAFRLGAADILLWPARDAEVVSAVDRVLTSGRETNARRRLDEQLKLVNEGLKQRVNALTTLTAVGKAVISITDRGARFKHIVKGALHVGAADLGCLLLRDDSTKSYVLASQRGFPDEWARKMNQPLDDGISSLAALSGESLLISGAPLQKYKLSSLGRAAAVVPIKVKDEVLGMLVLLRKAESAFGESEQSLVESLADFVSISLVNDRLFGAVGKTGEAARSVEKQQRAQYHSLRRAVQKNLDSILYPLGLMMTGKTGPLNGEQRKTLASANAAAQKLSELIQDIQSGK